MKLAVAGNTALIGVLLLNPNALAGECRLAKAGTLRTQIADGHVLVNVRINEYETLAFISSFPWTHIFPRTARAAGLYARDMNTNRGRTWVKARLVANGEPVKVARVEELRIGDYSLNKQIWHVHGDATAGSGQAGMVLGGDILRGMEIEFDLANQQLVLWNLKDCQNSPLAYWSQDFMRAKVMGTARGLFETDVVLNDKPVRAVIDAGAERTMIQQDAVEYAGGRLEEQPVQGVGEQGGSGASDFTVAHFDSFEMGDLTVNNIRVQVANISQHVERQIASGPSTPGQRYKDPGMFIGADFLRAMRLFISKSQGYVYMTYNGGAIFATDASAMTSDGLMLHGVQSNE